MAEHRILVHLLETRDGLQQEPADGRLVGGGQMAQQGLDLVVGRLTYLPEVTVPALGEPQAYETAVGGVTAAFDPAGPGEVVYRVVEGRGRDATASGQLTL